MQIIDAHIHQIDPTRPQGVPRPEPGTPLYKPTLPAHLRAEAAGLGVTGAVAIEWSSWPEDNRWLLDLAASDPYIVGVVGNLEAGTPGFDARLAQVGGDERFVGIRVGTPWCPLDLANPQLLADLHSLAAFGLALDAVTVGGGTVALLHDLIALTDAIPTLRVIVDHLPFEIAPADRDAYVAALRELGQRPNVWGKLSNPVPRTSGPIPDDPGFYRARFAAERAAFDDAHLMYGSNWPVSSRFAPYARVFALLHAFAVEQGSAFAERYFFENARVAYRLPDANPPDEESPVGAGRSPS